MADSEASQNKYIETEGTIDSSDDIFNKWKENKWNMSESVEDSTHKIEEERLALKEQRMALEEELKKEDVRHKRMRNSYKSIKISTNEGMWQSQNNWV